MMIVSGWSQNWYESPGLDFIMYIVEPTSAIGVHYITWIQLTFGSKSELVWIERKYPFVGPDVTDITSLSFAPNLNFDAKNTPAATPPAPLSNQNSAPSKIAVNGFVVVGVFVSPHLWVQPPFPSPHVNPRVRRIPCARRQRCGWASSGIRHHVIANFALYRWLLCTYVHKNFKMSWL